MSRTLSSFLAILGLGAGVLLCVGLVLWQGLGAADARALAAGLSLFWCAVVLALTAALMFCGERKWGLLSRCRAARGPAMEAPFLRRHYLWQNWVGQFIPPSVAIILGRAWVSRRAGEGVRGGLASGLFDQATDFAALCALLPGAAFVLFGGTGWGAFFAGSALGLAALFGMGPFLTRRFLSREAFPALFGWSVARALLTLLRLLAGVKALSLSLPLLPVAALTPIVSFVALIPLSPGNLGLAEWGWAFGLVFAGQSAHTATLYALGFRLLILVAQTLLLALNELYVLAARK